MSDIETQEEQAEQPNPMAELLAEIKRDSAAKAERDEAMLSELRGLRQPAQQQQVDADDPYETAESKEIRRLRNEMGQFATSVVSETSELKRDKVETLISRNSKLSEEEKEYALKNLGTVPAERVRAADPRALADLLAGQAKLYAPAPDVRKREPSAGPAGSTGIDSGYAKWLREECGYKYDDKKLVEMKLHTDTGLKDLYRKSGGKV